MKGSCLTVLAKCGHYDLLYEKDLLKRIPSLAKYDELPMKLYRQPSLLKQCQCCKKMTGVVEDVINLGCGHTYHKHCLAVEVEVSTQHRLFPTALEKEATSSPACPSCYKALSSADVQATYDVDIMTCYTQLKEYRELRELEIAAYDEDSKWIQAFCETSSILPNATCHVCKQAIKVQELFRLDCNHAYHLDCAKRCVERLTNGKLFLTEAEKRMGALGCVRCGKDIDSITIERLYRDCPVALREFKEDCENRAQAGLKANTDASTDSASSFCS